MFEEQNYFGGFIDYDDQFLSSKKGLRASFDIYYLPEEEGKGTRRDEDERWKRKQDRFRYDCSFHSRLLDEISYD